MNQAETGDKTEQVHCNECGHKTNHEVLLVRRNEGSEPYDENISIWWLTVYTVLECLGCNNVSLRKAYYFSEWDPGYAQIEFFPPHISRRVPRWVHRLSDGEAELLLEVYRAIASDSRRIAVMGARALVDMFIVRSIGDNRSFEEKLRSLVAKGFLSEKNAEVLSAALDAGNASAHRGFRPSAAHLNGVLDIVENLLHADLLQEEARDLRQSVPARKKADNNP